MRKPQDIPYDDDGKSWGGKRGTEPDDLLALVSCCLTHWPSDEPIRLSKNYSPPGGYNE